MRTITQYSMPSGERVVAEDADFLGVVAFYKHNPELAKEEYEFSRNIGQAQKLLHKQAGGVRLSTDELAFITEVRDAMDDYNQLREPLPGEITEPDPEITQASKQDLRAKGISL
jgi:hypothetical protein